MKIFLKIVLVLFVLGVLIVLGALGFLYKKFNEPYQYVNNLVESHYADFQKQSLDGFLKFHPYTLASQNIIKDAEKQDIDLAWAEDEFDIFTLFDLEELSHEDLEKFRKIAAIKIKGYKNKPESSDTTKELFSAKTSMDAVFDYAEYIRFKLSLILIDQIEFKNRFTLDTLLNEKQVFDNILEVADKDSPVIQTAIQDSLFRDYSETIAPAVYACEQDEDIGEKEILFLYLKARTITHYTGSQSQIIQQMMDSDLLSLHQVSDVFLTDFENPIDKALAWIAYQKIMIPTADSILKAKYVVDQLQQYPNTKQMARLNQIVEESDSVNTAAIEKAVEVPYRLKARLALLQSLNDVCNSLQQSKQLPQTLPPDPYLNGPSLLTKEKTIYSVGPNLKDDGGDSELDLILLEERQIAKYEKPLPDLSVVDEIIEVTLQAADLDVDMNQVYTQIRAVPFFANGEPKGFKILSLKNGTVFDKTGFQRGDIVLSFNGQDLNMQNAMKLFKDVRDPQIIKVFKILRDGKVIQLKVNIE